MSQSTISIQVDLDEQKLPETIRWTADNRGEDDASRAKAFFLSFWDGAEKTALRIDLWTKDMMVDEMADFVYQTLMTMADTYGRATQYADQVTDMKEFARDFMGKFRKKQQQEGK
ncbi:gliding motility protein GldC [Compostibacter hankyongensis]